MKQDIYQEITNDIIDALERVSPEEYQAPFAQLTASKAPINPVAERPYHGINTLALWLKQQSREYSSNEWATFKQWKDKGASVKKGEKSTKVIFYRKVEKKEVADGEQDFYHVLKSYCVFNADQVSGYEPETGLEEGTPGVVDTVPQIERFVKRTRVKIDHEGNRAYYSTLNDTISMPDKALFFDTEQSATENYYAVLLHELTHWSGGKPRLDRIPRDIGSNERAYAYEELIAELGSAFLCGQFSIKQQGREDHAAYIKSWLKALRNDKKYIFKAAAQAQRAVDFLNALAGD